MVRKCIYAQTQNYIFVYTVDYLKTRMNIKKEETIQYINNSSLLLRRVKSMATTVYFFPD